MPPAYPPSFAMPLLVSATRGMYLLLTQIATAVWIIDKLALRVGGEKGADEADTVGCCSLRTEHLTFHEDSSVHEVDLEFLGKDSMLFKERIDFDKYEDIGRRVFKNLQQFCKGKRQSEEVFDYLDPRWVGLDWAGQLEVGLLDVGVRR